jgi:anti-anti-sigma regulatory factor/DNA-binding NarL/FixJ family response regulator
MRFLLVDDRPADRELVIRRLQRAYPEAGFAEVTKKKELQAALAAGNFDVVITDYYLNWTDGLQVLRAVKEKFPDLPVIMVTGTGSEEVAIEGMKAGLSDYVLKRHLQRLPLAVRESVEKAQLHKDHERTIEQLRASEEKYRLASEELDRRVEERTAELAAAYETMRDLSTPVLKVADRLLILPLIGAIEPARARQLTEQLLSAVRANRARVVVMDLTGVPVIDTAVANSMVRTVDAARLLGATIILTGISRDIAQTLVTVGVDLDRMNTRGDLQSGIEEGFHTLGYELQKTGNAINTPPAMVPRMNGAGGAKEPESARSLK